MRPFFSAIALCFVTWLAFPTPWGMAYTANKVWFEFMPRGGYRVHVSYTVPEMKELREAYVDFHNRNEAEAFYWDLVRGADFYMDNPKARRFLNHPMKPNPW